MIIIICDMCGKIKKIDEIGTWSFSSYSHFDAALSNNNGEHVLCKECNAIFKLKANEIEEEKKREIKKLEKEYKEKIKSIVRTHTELRK